MARLVNLAGGARKFAKLAARELARALFVIVVLAALLAGVAVVGAATKYTIPGGDIIKGVITVASGLKAGSDAVIFNFETQDASNPMALVVNSLGDATDATRRGFSIDIAELGVSSNRPLILLHGGGRLGVGYLGTERPVSAFGVRGGATIGAPYTGFVAPTDGLMVFGKTALGGGVLGFATSDTVVLGGAIRIKENGVQPTCDATYRGQLWNHFSATGVKDTAQLCLKDAADVYAWRTIY